MTEVDTAVIKCNKTRCYSYPTRSSLIEQHCVHAPATLCRHDTWPHWAKYNTLASSAGVSERANLHVFYARTLCNYPRVTPRSAAHNAQRLRLICAVGRHLRAPWLAITRLEHRRHLRARGVRSRRTHRDGTPHIAAA